MQDGRILHAQPSLNEISEYRRERLAKLPQEHKRFENPHIYKVGISGNLRDWRNELRNQHKTL
jgi:nicotinate phosphoribosyltransferase